MNESPDPPPSGRALTVAVVGPCCSGKSTLVAALRACGYNARHVAQEHSFVPEMWQCLTNPDALIYLDASHETIMSRLQLRLSPAELAEQLRRLRHARQHAGLYLPTDRLTPEEMISSALDFLEKRITGDR